MNKIFGNRFAKGWNAILGISPKGDWDFGLHFERDKTWDNSFSIYLYFFKFYFVLCFDTHTEEERLEIMQG